MKKLILLFVSALLTVSCDVNDGGPITMLAASEVTETDLPEFFEAGKTYTVKVTYLLPSACHFAAGVDARRGGDSSEQYREIYVRGMASYDANLTECDEEVDEEELEKEGTFQITITPNEEDPYTFYLWTGINENEENIYTEVVVPVGDPDITE